MRIGRFACVCIVWRCSVGAAEVAGAGACCFCTRGRECNDGWDVSNRNSWIIYQWMFNRNLGKGIIKTSVICIWYFVLFLIFLFWILITLIAYGYSRKNIGCPRPHLFRVHRPSSQNISRLRVVSTSRTWLVTYTGIWTSILSWKRSLVGRRLRTSLSEVWPKKWQGA